jgi:serine/threonine protein kinase
MKPSSNAPQVGSVVTIGALENEKFVIGKILLGGMGEVYQLIPIVMSRPALALKTYQPSADREQFIREADIWISLGNHPNIARAFMYLEWQSKPSIISSWYKQPADAVLTKRWPADKFTNFTAMIISALQQALMVGHVIHQDVKPANILLDKDDNPRLTDFGMARFSAALNQPIRSISDVDTSMGQSVTLGPLGGTPLYMAPELFNGAQPSVQTDIFSLGVTLYEVLTGAHPYCGPETGNRLRPTLRQVPLARALHERGAEFAPLIALITAAVQIETRKRPGSYDALIGLISGPHEAHGVINCNSVTDLIVRAAFLRDTGRNQESLELLRSALNTRPANPELLNSYAVQLWKLGHKAEAYSSWKAAVESLTFTNGRHDHKVYPDPAVNLAWRMVGEGRFDKADQLLKLVSVWCQDAQNALYSYMEMGWWHLYNGRFEDAWEHIVACARSKMPDEMSLWSLTLAAWLSENFEHKVKTLVKLYSSVSNAGETTALVACVLATYCPERSRGNLLAIAYPKYEGRLASVAKEIGIDSLDWRTALPSSVVRLIFRSLDAIVTGGNNYGTI